MKRVLILLVLITCIVNAYTISGKIYDSNLNPVNTALVQINSPKQISLATNANYTFNLSKGEYEIQVAAVVNNKNLTYKDNITIENSDVTYDIILIENQVIDSSLNQLTQSLNENYSVNYQKPQENNQFDYTPFALLLLAALIAIFAFKNKKPKPTTNLITPSESLILEKADEYKQQILSLLDKQGGAASQKELRSELPWSEARVSIELSELEKQGKIKRVKTGRANLIKKV